MLLGAAAGALWVVAGRRWMESEEGLLDWDRVRRIAIRASGTDQPQSGRNAAELLSRYEAMVRRLEDPISAYTRTTLPSSRTPVSVLDRKGWIDANVDSFRSLFKPVDEIYQELEQRSAVAVPGLSLLSRTALSTQMGLLLGYLSRRVLGQYDMSVLGREPLSDGGGKLYFVQPNIEGIEAQLDLPPEEFRTWIVLHESTHAHEFEVFPWLRDYMNHILRAYLDSLLQEVRGGPGAGGAIPAALVRIVSSLRSGGSLLDAVMSPRQRHHMGRMQALMCLLEGYSNHVMNAVGRGIMPHFDRIKQRVESRSRDRGKAEELLQKLTGLSMKMDQYRLGERFVDCVVQREGIEFLNQAYEGPENLPTMEEILHPDRWIKRMENAA